jgi:hypothetical protein
MSFYLLGKVLWRKLFKMRVWQQKNIDYQSIRYPKKLSKSYELLADFREINTVENS